MTEDSQFAKLFSFFPTNRDMMGKVQRMRQFHILCYSVSTAYYLIVGFIMTFSCESIIQGDSYRKKPKCLGTDQQG